MEPVSPLEVRDVGKRYCRDLKRSLWYGMSDICSEILLRGEPSQPCLRAQEFWAVSGASFTVSPGECVALIGPNGAGKSTLLKMINGLVKPDFGEIRIRGRVSALIELGSGFHPILTARENIYVNAAILGFSAREVDRRLDAIIDFSELDDDALDAPVRSFSSGMRVRLGFAIAANLQPDLILVDEVLAVGDVGFRLKCFDHILTLMDRGTALVVVSHSTQLLSRVARRAVLLDAGKQVFDGTLEEGIARYEQALLHPEHRTEAGDGTARIGAIRTLDRKGDERRQFETGEDIVFEIELNTEEHLDCARLTVNIASASGGTLSSFFTPAGGFDVDPPGTTVRLVLRQVPLLTGSYHLNVSFFGRLLHEFHDRATTVGMFRVTGRRETQRGRASGGLIRLDHEWALPEAQ
jgi:lipopolysaccharide transport system ATP-binding protein